VLDRLARKDPRALAMICASLVPKTPEVDAKRVIYRVRDTPLTAEEWEAKHCRQPEEPADGGETEH
jgi:hypothetical protein